ncbi:MAG: SCO2522 family protein, partial [Pseudonocardiaceae bacterium]
MAAVRPWNPPRETAANRHSIYVDVELWDDDGDRRTWSCAFLAAVWQLLRLGLLRYHGKPVVSPRPWAGDWPSDWADLPAVVRLDPAADSFYGYRTLSVLAGRFLPIEHAVRIILSQVAVDELVDRQALDRSAAEGIELSHQLVDRIEYVLTGSTVAWR